ncbi:AIPR family protein [Erysipelothrix sp. HDW6C]|uniref:AIPR family protein n=1 Tax=Erysipelothrix sp. HDW6C TaxID=2714930 RepID=UPI00140B2B70|nr:AIPR family protein [Erysipelothrix sp. HDW6C]QIK70268.1 AIPR family protein [Erysipelothrix sp. HDW6C]
MNVYDFISDFTTDAQVEANVHQTSIEEAYLVKIADMLVESEVITDYFVGYFKKTGRQNRKVEINGFYYDDADGSYTLFIVDDLASMDDKLRSSQLDSLIKGVEELVYVGIEGKYSQWEESSVGFEVASQINTLYKNREQLEHDFDLKKIKISILTNKQLSSRFKNSKREDIHEIPVEYNVYDASRLFDMAKSGFEKEPVNITFSDYGYEGIKGILSTQKENEFTSYLATIPGELLARIYLDKGTQILEGNVRAFLSVRGKVNKGIRKTILSEPKKFFILNNGITVTGDGIETMLGGNEILITTINNLQIVNGGQTTASLANALLKDKADLSEVQVMMKLSILENTEVAEQLVPEIARTSNSQNKVDESDFFSNHPFHVKIQELSEKNLAPAVDGNQYQTSWFYERARGQYTVQEMKLTDSQVKAWRLKNPKNQVLKKTDIAKYFMTFEGEPQNVSRGAQTVTRLFSAKIQGSNGDDGLWSKNSSDINAKFFKELVAKAILFRETEKLVSNQEWYKEIKAYRANIVAYSIALLSNHAKKVKLEIDLNRIWMNQSLFSELESQLEVTTLEVYNFLTRDDRLTQNVTEWAKKDEAWKRAKAYSWTFNDSFNNTLLTKEIIKPKDVTESTVDSMNFVVNKDLNLWIAAKEWGIKYLYLTPKDEAMLDMAIALHTRGKVPTDKQFNEIVSVYNSLVNKGMEP